MKKRLWTIFLVLCLMLGMLPGTARAAEVASGACGADGGRDRYPRRLFLH